MAEYIVSGHRAAMTGELVPPPFPNVKVFTRSRTRQEWESGALVPIEHLEGMSVFGCFALCAPGEIREVVGHVDLDILNRSLPLSARDRTEMADQLQKANRDSYLLANDSHPDLPNSDAKFCIVFDGPDGRDDVLLASGAEGAVEVYTATDNGWTREATLRDLVVKTMAELTE